MVTSIYDRDKGTEGSAKDISLLVNDVESWNKGTKIAISRVCMITFGILITIFNYYYSNYKHGFQNRGNSTLGSTDNIINLVYSIHIQSIML